MMVIFPFEEPFYRDRGVDAEFVGHPLAELPLPTISREDYAAKHTASTPQSPGSPCCPAAAGRRSQPNLADHAARCRTASLSDADYEFLLPVASTIDRTAADYIALPDSAAIGTQ